MAGKSKITCSQIGKKVNLITYTSEPYTMVYGGKNRRFIDGVCECGKEVSILFMPYSSNHNISCGCASLRFKDRYKANKMRNSFTGMHRRCNATEGPHYKYYKGKGVKVSKRWNEFPLFYEDMEATWFPGAQLDRYPNRTGDYEPGNVRWATTTQQQRNKDSVLSEEQVATIRSSSLSQKELSEMFGVRDSCISRIINHKRWKNKI